MRLIERNDLREIEGQQFAKYLEKLKLVIKAKIKVQVLGNLFEALNIALKAELMLQEKNKHDYSCKSYNGDNYRASNNKNKSIHDSSARNDQYREEKTTGK